jgi:hypothetical protein
VFEYTNNNKEIHYLFFCRNKKKEENLGRLDGLNTPGVCLSRGL